MTDDTSPGNGFPAHWRQPDAAPLRWFDWRGEGIDIPYVLLITGRCGSTHLASLLTESRACGEPIEYFNALWLPSSPEAATAHSLGEYILHVVRARSSNRRFGFKIDSWRWKWLRSQIDVERFFPAAKCVFFLMTRQDVVAQAHSFAVARATDVWHAYADAPASRQQTYIPTDHEILQEMSLIARSETAWSRYIKRSGRSVMRLTYEQLLQDPEGLLRRFGERLALEPIWLDKLKGVASRVQKHAYTRREEQIDGLKTRLAQEVAFLETCRENYDYEPFYRLVLELRGIDLATWCSRQG